MIAEGVEGDNKINSWTCQKNEASIRPNLWSPDEPILLILTAMLYF